MSWCSVVCANVMCACVTCVPVCVSQVEEVSRDVEQERAGVSFAPKDAQLIVRKPCPDTVSTPVF